MKPKRYSMEYLRVIILVWICGLRFIESDQQFEGSSIPCYDSSKRAQKCIPQFENAAFGLEAEATNTCGERGPIQYCVMSNTQGIEQGCKWCNSSHEHRTAYMTDSSSTFTWWQSETMFEEIQYPNHVNITLNFGKTFDITYITLTFKNPRPHSFAIYKKTTEDGPWIPYQYYSANCEGMYNLPDGNFIRKGINETVAFCTSEYSDISPMSDTVVAFPTLDGRPSANEYSFRPELWDWVTATSIRITLNRLNTLGDEIWRADPGLKSYFYAISDLNIGARCKCNGHAAHCDKIGSGSVKRRVCLCEHYTTGPDCNECQPFYNDAPWRRASEDDPFACQPCDCNGFSNRCYFDKELYQATGHGGHCLECTSNRDGPKCERCRVNYFQPVGQEYCYPCECNEIGSLNLQCNREGKCFCKPGVTGDKCDRCDNNFYDFGPSGCKECGCSVAGSLQTQTACDSVTGKCNCKENVEGNQCSKCKPGYFNIDEANEFGCTPCFCYGHSSKCDSASGYSKILSESNFIRGAEKWKAEYRDGRSVTLNYNTFNQVLEISTPSVEAVYFAASDRYLGDQRASYNHDLTFKLRISDNSAVLSVEDIVIEGAGMTISQSIFGQRNPLPSVGMQTYRFRLHENPIYGWSPRLSTRDFISILTNVTAIKIRGTYTPLGSGWLDDFALETARRDAAGKPATWIEMCSCPEGYIGQYCESCAAGFRHDAAIGGPFAPCVPCNCNKHAKICDADTGRCICEHNTAGDNCDRCARGYYGNALMGTPVDCSPCPCPNHGACTLIGDDDTIVCLECPTGYGGALCEVCSDGYYGDPKGVYGPARICQSCDCNSNVDPNAIGNCNRTSGECLKCIHNTGGFHCDQCLPGYYGDALAPGKGDCKRCLCHPLGTLEYDNGELDCDQLSGQCKCKPHVIGTNCDECEPGFFDLNSGQGCQSCGCDPIGSLNNTCDVETGQCHCRPGVTGLHCNQCYPYYYGFSVEGCKTCDCDRIGSASLQCDSRGQCPCFDNIEGRKCDRCKENKYDRQRGCINCPPCYNLVRDAVNSHRQKLHILEESITNISNSDSVSLDTDFDEKMKYVHDKVDALAENAKKSTGSDGQLTTTKLNDLYKRLDDIKNTTNEIANLTSSTLQVVQKAESNLTDAESLLEDTRRTLAEAEDYLLTDGKSALFKAINKSAEVGVQNAQMSQISRDARMAVQKQEEEAEKIRALADDAFNLSSDAYNRALEAMNKQKSISESLKTLNSTLIYTVERLNMTVDTVKNVKSQVDLAYDDSLSVLRDIQAITLPVTDSSGSMAITVINITNIKENSLNFSKMASENLGQAEKLFSENRNLMLELNEKLSSAENLLQRGHNQQQKADELLADVDSAFQKAVGAVELGNKTLEEAKRAYKTLQGFNEIVQRSKDKAKEAKQKLPEISALIQEVEEKTKSVDKIVQNAQNSANMSRIMAGEAEKVHAARASEDAYSLRIKAEAALSEQSKFGTEVDEMKKQVSDKFEELKALKDIASKDHDTISNAKEKVGQAKANAADVRRSVDKAEEEIQNILKELNSLPEIDESSLTKLTEKLQTSEKQIDNSKVDEVLLKFKTMRYEQVEKMRRYNSELEQLEKDVKDLERIRDSLPRRCFKLQALEN